MDRLHEADVRCVVHADVPSPCQWCVSDCGWHVLDMTCSWWAENQRVRRHHQRTFQGTAGCIGGGGSLGHTMRAVRHRLFGVREGPAKAIGKQGSCSEEVVPVNLESASLLRQSPVVDHLLFTCSSTC